MRLALIGAFIAVATLIVALLVGIFSGRVIGRAMQANWDDQ